MSDNCLTPAEAHMHAKDPLRAVTVRDLARNTAAILDELHSTARPVVITRGGIPVASLQPLDTQPWRPIALQNPLEVAEAEPINLGGIDAERSPARRHLPPTS
ncbi:MAG: type II toxin-antitoxin system Phd/YefM family antitoxin [Actinomycetota bacterium]